MIKWIEGPSKEEDVVISTRIRLARNIDQYKFPANLTVGEADMLTSKILEGIKDKLEDNYSYYRIRDLDKIRQYSLVEKHIISPNMIRNKNKSSFLLREDEKVSIMLNEEDHIRIQVLDSSLNLEEAWKLASEVDDILDESLSYAFDKKWGFLTSCPTNVGTGMRASLMMHLPCISMTGNMDSLINGLAKIDIATRGIYGEGSQTIGNIYQISNQKTLGEGEEDTIEKLNSIAMEIIDRERELREYLKVNKPLEIEDKIYRSLGILKYSRTITIKEAMSHFSNIRLGWELGILPRVAYKDLLQLIIKVQPSSIQDIRGDYIYIDERNALRALEIRDFMEKLEV